MPLCSSQPVPLPCLTLCLYAPITGKEKSDAMPSMLLSTCAPTMLTPCLYAPITGKEIDAMPLCSSQPVPLPC